MITLERFQENVAAIVGLLVLLLIPFIDELAREPDLPMHVFYITLAVVLSGDVRASLMPILRAFAERTPTKMDDKALDLIEGKKPA